MQVLRPKSGAPNDEVCKGLCQVSNSSARVAKGSGLHDWHTVCGKPCSRPLRTSTEWADAPTFVIQNPKSISLAMPGGPPGYCLKALFHRPAAEGTWPTPVSLQWPGPKRDRGPSGTPLLESGLPRRYRQQKAFAGGAPFPGARVCKPPGSTGSGCRESRWEGSGFGQRAGDSSTT